MVLILVMIKILPLDELLYLLYDFITKNVLCQEVLHFLFDFLPFFPQTWQFALEKRVALCYNERENNLAF